VLEGVVVLGGGDDDALAFEPLARPAAARQRERAAREARGFGWRVRAQFQSPPPPPSLSTWLDMCERASLSTKNTRSYQLATTHSPHLPPPLSRATYTNLLQSYR